MASDQVEPGRFEPPSDKKYDWIQLTSLEWLKGEFISLYNHTLEFDSDELDMQRLDWEDVRQIRSAIPLSLRLESRNGSEETFEVIGKLLLIGNEVSVTSDGQTKSFTRQQIISIAKGTGKESDLWTGRIFLGANIKGGNTDTTDANFIVDAKRLTSESRLYIEYLANFSETDDVETSNNHRITSYYDSFLSSELFWRVYTAEYFRDHFKNIDDEVSLGSSFGYDIIRNAKTEWDVTGGAGVLYKRFESVEVGEDIDNTSPFLGFGTMFDTEVTKWVDYDAELVFKIVDEQSGEHILHFTTTVSTDVTKNLDFDVSLIWDWVEKPQPDADGNIPEKDDYQVVIGLDYDI